MQRRICSNEIEGVSPNNFLSVLLDLGAVIYLRTDRFEDAAAEWLREGRAFKISDGVLALDHAESEFAWFLRLPARGHA
jgi:hypothetical protein